MNAVISLFTAFIILQSSDTPPAGIGIDPADYRRDTDSGAATPARSLRIVIADTAPPRDLLFTGLVRTDSTGAIVPAMADSWNVSEDYLRWRFRLGSGMTFSSGRAISPEDVVASLLSTISTRGYKVPIRTVDIEEDDITVLLAEPDPLFLRRLALPSSGIAGRRGEYTGPYTIQRADTYTAELVRNSHAVIEGASDSLAIIYERNLASGVFLVESGRADAALVGDEDFGRIASADENLGRLIRSQNREVHVLECDNATETQLELVRIAVNREIIVRMLMNRRGISTGPRARALTPDEITEVGLVALTAPGNVLERHNRVINRIRFDLEQSGLAVALDTNTRDSGQAAKLIRYAVYNEFDVPVGALPIYTLDQYWLLAGHVRGFVKPMPGNCGFIGAYREVGR